MVPRIKQTVCRTVIREMIMGLVESVTANEERLESPTPGPSNAAEVIDSGSTSSSESSETDDEWEVDYVVSHRLDRGVYLYKLRWKNFGPDSDTWHPARLIPGCCQLIIKYWERRASLRRQYIDDEAVESWRKC
jgi:hypothetical protein